MLFTLFKYRKELKIALEDIRAKKLKEKHEVESHHLRLCKKHQQEAKRSHYSECNCDYCNLLKGIKRDVDK